MKDIIFGFFLGSIFVIWLVLTSDAFVSISTDGYMIRGGETYRLVPVNAEAGRIADKSCSAEGIVETEGTDAP